MSNRIDRFFRLMVDRGASDMHLSVGRPPIFRSSGRIEPIRYRVLDDADFMGLLEPITPPEMWKDFLVSGDLDYAYEVPGLARFRVNLFRQERGFGAVFRVIPSKILTLEQLRMPKAVHKLVDFTSGLVLVTGPTGSGKSTTLAAIINEMNATRPMHFVTIEDPIEFVHQNQQSLVSQREVHKHSHGFREALRSAVREDPDCILVGEMRDLETISMALSAAETGLLVLEPSIPTRRPRRWTASSTCFPAINKWNPGILASVIKYVISQQLLRRKRVESRLWKSCLYRYFLIDSSRQDSSAAGAIQQGVRYGMVGMDASLRKLVEEMSLKWMLRLKNRWIRIWANG